MEKHNILVVDDEELILNSIKTVLSRTYNVIVCKRVIDAIAEINVIAFSVVILDINLIESNGLKLLEFIKNVSPETNVIMITGFATAEVAIEALKGGACDFLIKPFSMQELSKSVERILELKAVESINSIEVNINILLKTTEKRDPYISKHQRRVADLSKYISKKMDFPEQTVKSIYFSSLVHDIGKIYIPTDILNKPGKLNEAEMNLIKLHPKASYDIIKEIKNAEMLAKIVLSHHEYNNGSGYPQGITAEQIPFESKIITIADIIEAIVSHRPYRPALSVDVAIDEISKNRGVLYDKRVSDFVIDMLKNHYDHIKECIFREIQ